MLWHNLHCSNRKRRHFDERAFGRTPNHCDQMVWLFFNTESFIPMETCPKAQQFANVGLKIAQYYFKPLKIAQRLAEFGQSCETSPNLVTLHQTDISDDIRLAAVLLTNSRGPFRLRWKSTPDISEEVGSTLPWLLPVVVTRLHNGDLHAVGWGESVHEHCWLQ